jgi:twinkle protein
MASLTSIESVARQLDDVRQTRLSTKTVDFDAYLRAREDDIGNIKRPNDFRDDLIDEFFGDPRQHGLELPWSKTTDNFLIRPGEVTIWTGYNGHMKSMCTGYVLLHLMSLGEKACIASFEMKPRKTLRRLASQAIGTRNPTEKYIGKFLDLCEGNLWLYDQQGETTPERILGVIYYCAEQLGVTQFVVDSLMKVVANEDDYNGQKRFIGQLCTAAKDLGIHIHLVHHSRKRDDESKRPGKQDAKGTGAIVDQCDNFIAVYKFPRKDTDEDDKPTHGLYVDKQRHGEWEGLIALWFDDTSLQFKQSATDRVSVYVND